MRRTASPEVGTGVAYRGLGRAFKTSAMHAPHPKGMKLEHSQLWDLYCTPMTSSDQIQHYLCSEKACSYSGTRLCNWRAGASRAPQNFGTQTYANMTQRNEI